MEFELQRPDFTVESLESRHSITLPADGDCSDAPCFTINYQIDRMDCDEAGQRILIDYKTGAPQSPSDWLGERIREVQLPLYAVALKLNKGDAVCFAHVRSGNQMGWRGLSGHDTGIPGVLVCDAKNHLPDDWEALLTQWRDYIHAVSRDFAAGVCQVDPIDARSCQHCHLQALCRIEETGFQDE